MVYMLPYQMGYPPGGTLPAGKGFASVRPVGLEETFGNRVKARGKTRVETMIQNQVKDSLR